jgi:ribosomal protein S6--L-glutamate ligase
MRIAVLSSEASWYFRDLARAADRRHELLAVPYSGLAARLDPGCASFTSGAVDLGACAAVIVRSMPPGSLESIVFRMDLLARLEASGVAVINPPRAIEAAVDKFLSTARLREAGLLIPPTHVCQSAQQALVAFEQLGGDVVVKPLFGGEGRGLTRVSDPAVAMRVFRALEQINSVLYLQQFIPHDGVDWRLLVVGDEVFGMRRRSRDDWRTNISLGGKPEPLHVGEELAHLARRAAAAVGASVAGVDLLPGKDGLLYALEVNGVPGWRALAGVSGVDIAAHVLKHVVDFVSSTPSSAEALNVTIQA